jgi:hypothetical protein
VGTGQSTLSGWVVQRFGEEDVFLVEDQNALESAWLERLTNNHVVSTSASGH